jgi:hypothetical protein
VTGPFHFLPNRLADQAAQEVIMAKGQKRNNREMKKPKKEAAAVIAPVAAKGFLASATPAKKKK